MSRREPRHIPGSQKTVYAMSGKRYRGSFAGAYQKGSKAGKSGQPIEDCPYFGSSRWKKNYTTTWETGWRDGTVLRERERQSRRSYRISYRDNGRVSFYRQTVSQGRGKKPWVLFSPPARAYKYYNRKIAERVVEELQKHLPVLRGGLFIQEMVR